MRCCFPECISDTIEATKSDGITFHKFPTNKNLRKKWLNILNLSEKDVTTESVVCTIHFNKDDQYLNDEGIHELKDWASPIPKFSDDYMSSPASQKVCRVCLAANVKLFDIMDPNIFDDYVNVTGLIIYPQDIFPKVVCWECAAKLKTANALREKALRTHALLTENAHLFVPFITIEHTQKMNRYKNKLTSDLVKKINKTNEYNLLITDEAGPDVQEEKVKRVAKEEVNCGHTETHEDTDLLIELRHGSQENKKNNNEKRKRVNRVFKNINMKKDGKVNQGDSKNNEMMNIHIVNEDEVVHDVLKDGVKSETIDSVKSETIDVEFKEIEFANENIECVNNDIEHPIEEIKFEKVANDDIEFDTSDKEFGNNDVDLASSETTIDSDADSDAGWLSDAELNDSGKVSQKPGTSRSSKKARKRRGSQKKTLNTAKTEIQLDESMFTITQLNFAEEIAAIERRKDSEAYKSARLKCAVCCVLHKSESTAAFHALRHAEISGKFSCQVCKRRFKTRSRLNKHISTTHVVKYSCKLCKFVTNCRGRAILHEKFHKGVKYKCPHCPVVFEKSTSYFSHLRLNHMNRFVCDQCGFCFVSEKGVQAHKKKRHIKEQNTLEGPFCDDCDIRFASQEAYDTHLKTSLMHCKDDDPKRIRNDCTVSNNGKKPLNRRHYLIITRDSSSTNEQTACELDTSEGPFCGDCDIRFASQKAYDTHLKTSAHCKDDDDKRTRNVCKILIKKKNKKKHRNRLSDLDTDGESNSKNKQPACEVCGEVFDGFRLYYLHFRDAHPGHNRTVFCSPARCMCEQCGKLFKCKTELAEHMNIHTGTNQFKCDKCHEAFPTSGKLYTHRQKHITEQCHICGGWFLSKNCKRHVMMVHNGAKPYRCGICEKSVSTKIGLQQHIAHVHNGEPWPKRVRRRAKPEVSRSQVQVQN